MRYCRRTLRPRHVAAALRCTRKLWWEVHQPGEERSAESDRAHERWDDGRRVTEAARARRPEGTVIDVTGEPGEDAVRQTASAIEDGARLLYDATFEAEGIIVKIDMLERRDDDHWAVTCVEPSLGIDRSRLRHLALGVLVCRRAGIAVYEVRLMHLNRRCRHPDLTDLFVESSVTGAIDALQNQADSDVLAWTNLLFGPVPAVAVGDHCEDPVRCPFHERCWSHLPVNPIATLHGVGRDLRAELESKGFRAIRDLPPEVPLTPIQARQRRAVRRKAIVLSPGLADSLVAFDRPAAYLSFGSVRPPIPTWPGCRPYRPVPVRMTVEFERETGERERREWMTEGAEDPRRSIAERLIEFTQGARSIVVYGRPFARRRIRDLRECFPEMTGSLDRIESRLVDLLPVVQHHVYHPNFQGRFDLETVATALVSQLHYDRLPLEDPDGSEYQLSSLLFEKNSISPETRDRLRRGLLSLGRIEVRAMVHLIRRLRTLAVAGKWLTSEPAIRVAGWRRRRTLQDRGPDRS